MLRFAARVLCLAPALTFGLGAAFVAASYYLTASPSDPSAWQALFVLAPLMREPVYLVAGLPGSGYDIAFIFFLAAALIGAIIAFSSLRTGRALFIYAHFALLTLFYSMSGEGVFAAGGDLNDLAAGSSMGWTPHFASFPPFGVALFAVVALACAVSHLLVLRRTLTQSAANRELHARLIASLNEFA
jgi:hypothetical protein